MKFFPLNIRGTNNLAKRYHLKEVIIEKCPGCIGLQESKLWEVDDYMINQLTCFSDMAYD